MYIELHTSSAFSFLRGASLPETLVARAAALAYPAVALLDRDGVYGLPRFYQAARAAGLRAIVGAELTITPGPGHADCAWLGGSGARDSSQQNRTPLDDSSGSAVTKSSRGKAAAAPPHAASG